MPPNYTVGRARGCLEFITEAVIELKRRYKDPYLIVAWDFNQWDVGSVLEDHDDIREVDVGPTRGDRSIDKIFCNYSRSIIESGTLPLWRTMERERISGLVITGSPTRGQIFQDVDQGRFSNTLTVILRKTPRMTSRPGL